jgi:hypothetical protein
MPTNAELTAGRSSTEMTTRATDAEKRVES